MTIFFDPEKVTVTYSRLIIKFSFIQKVTVEYKTKIKRSREP